MAIEARCYLFKHSLRVGYPRGFLPPGPSVGEMLAGGELVHGDHGTAGLLAAELQHGEEVQGYGAHVGERANLEISILTFSPGHYTCLGSQLTGARERESEIMFGVISLQPNLQFVFDVKC